MNNNVHRIYVSTTFQMATVVRVFAIYVCCLLILYYCSVKSVVKQRVCPTRLGCSLESMEKVVVQCLRITLMDGTTHGCGSGET